jgi:hypothetical protein
MEANLMNKLSKLQKFILLEAAKSLPKLEEDARGLNAWRAPFIKPGTKPIEACDLSHITRTKILTKYFGFTMRKHRMWTFCGSFETDYDTGQISVKSAGRSRYNSANASLYRAMERLEKRGLIVRMRKHRGNMQLTEQGIIAAQMLRDLSFPTRRAVAGLAS